MFFGCGYQVNKSSDGKWNFGFEQTKKCVNFHIVPLSTYPFKSLKSLYNLILTHSVRKITHHIKPFISQTSVEMMKYFKFKHWMIKAHQTAYIQFCSVCGNSKKTFFWCEIFLIYRKMFQLLSMTVLSLSNICKKNFQFSSADFSFDLKIIISLHSENFFWFGGNIKRLVEFHFQRH